MSNTPRICHVVSGDLWGGAEAQVYQLARSMVDMNYRVFAITLNKGDLFDKFCDMPVEVTAFEESNMSVLAALFKIRSFIKHNKIDIVHCHGFKENFLAGMASKMFLDCKVVRTHHGRGVVNASFVKKLVEKLNAHLLTDKLIAVSRELKSCLIGLRYPEHKIEVVHNGIDCQTLHASRNPDELIEEYSIPAGSFIIGTACRIECEKGFQYLLLTVKELLDRGLPVVFVVVGTGNLQQKYSNMAEELNIANSVIFTGFQKDVSSYLNLFDLFVMMSLNEGIPLALIEAMGMSKPVVCSAVGGIPEVVTSGVNGILVPTKNYEACAKACHKIFSQKELQNSLGENARKHVIENFSSEVSANNTINLYKEVLTN